MKVTLKAAALGVCRVDDARTRCPQFRQLEVELHQHSPVFESDGRGREDSLEVVPVGRRHRSMTDERCARPDVDGWSFPPDDPATLEGELLLGAPESDLRAQVRKAAVAAQRGESAISLERCRRQQDQSDEVRHDLGRRNLSRSLRCTPFPVGSPTQQPSEMMPSRGSGRVPFMAPTARGSRAAHRILRSYPAPGDEQQADEVEPDASDPETAQGPGRKP